MLIKLGSKITLLLLQFCLTIAAAQAATAEGLWVDIDESELVVSYEHQQLTRFKLAPQNALGAAVVDLEILTAASGDSYLYLKVNISERAVVCPRKIYLFTYHNDSLVQFEECLGSAIVVPDIILSSAANNLCTASSRLMWSYPKVLRVGEFTGSKISLKQLSFYETLGINAIDIGYQYFFTRLAEEYLVFDKRTPLNDGETELLDVLITDTTLEDKYEAFVQLCPVYGALE